MASPTEIISCLRQFAVIEFNNIRKEITQCRNMPYAFTSIGDLGEELALYIYPDSIGSASKGGCAFDNRTISGDTCVAREIKTVSLNGSKKCSACGEKAPFMQPHCTFCSGVAFKYMEDSRAGIGAAAHVKYHDKLKEYLVFLVKYHSVARTINVRGFKFDSSNPYFDQMIRTQKASGKGDTCNFLPYSYDWHMSAPSLVLDVTLTADITAVVNFMDFDNSAIVPIPFKNYNSGNPIFTHKELSQRSLSEASFPLDYALGVSQFGHRKKAHGKARGNTSR